jgi:hypothetical protein
MLARVLRFVGLPLVLVVIYSIARFLLSLSGFPYAPRGNAVFSVVGTGVVMTVIYGALSKRVGNFRWVETILVGVVIGLAAQICIFTFTLVSYLAGIETYYTHWDALNLPEGTKADMGQALGIRAPALVVGPIFQTIWAVIGRLLSPLAPSSPSAT